VTTPPPAAPRTLEHEERYRALRTVATIIRVLAFIVAIVGGLAVVIGAINAMSSSGGAIGAGLLILVGGFLYVAVVALFLFAYAEIIRLVIAVEDNTRVTAEAVAGRGGQLP
jgi:TRAP-type C4-dicarboxylate transport system permease small subunit